LFRKFHPRINLTTLFFTKTYILNTIKPFSGHKNRPLGLKQQNLKNLSEEPEFQNSEYEALQVDLKDSGSQNFSIIAFIGEAVGL
jgi:hypothetical protein